MTEWADDQGLLVLPSGARVRGRALGDPACDADFTLVLAERQSLPTWAHRRVRWPDSWVPLDREVALDALREAHRRARAGERVEVGCRGGYGRTGTALAALVMLDDPSLSPRDAVRWVRGGYDRRAVEWPWQRRWLRHIARAV